MTRQNIFFVSAINIFLLFMAAFCAWPGETGSLNKNEKTTLLRIAKDTLVLYLNKQTVPSLESYSITANLKKRSGVFVTLEEKVSGNLRGCMGYIRGFKPLAEAVIDCTIQAATRDRRFLPMKQGEDQTVTIKISVLTPPRTISAVDEIKIGKHGLIISRGFKTGVLLPQVPVEQGWSRDDFLKAICRKAGLPDMAWKKGAALQVFSAQVFGDP